MKLQNFSPARLREISELAESIADEICPAPYSVLPAMIAEKIGITYHAANYGGYFEGYLEYFKGKFHIFLNLNEGEHLYIPRVRFSFAHELGHYFIDEHRQALIKPGVQPHGSKGIFSSDIKTEREADFFAACLLMPEKRLQNDVLRKKFNMTLMNELRNKYQVSMTALLLRFAVSGNHPLMVVCCMKNRIKWYSCSDDFPFRKPRSGAGGEVPECSAAAEFYRDGTKYQKAEKVFAEDWFEIWKSDDRGREFWEYCVYYEALDQVISVIWEG
jgi:Zn-dependent peptidase ImmA (M78 family)